MKKCPTCNRTFTDDALSFCLDDGSQLLSADSSGPGSYDPGATMQYNPARDTNPPPAYNPSQFPGQQSQQPSWSPMPQVGGMQGQPPPKKSKAIFWIIGGIAALVVVGIAVTVIALVLVGMSESNTNNGNANSSNTTANRNDNTSNANNSNAANTNTNTNTNTSADPSKVFIAQDDFTSVNWWTGSNTYGKAEYVNGEYQLSAGSENGYVAVYGPKAFITKDATTSVTTRSVTGASPPLGYGLTVFGELKDGQLEDYAFLIRTDANPAFRVALHKGGKETSLVNWTPASQIRGGSATNQLEVRASAGEFSFYINGQFATSVADTAGYKTGIAGVYTSGLSAIAFDDLDIFR